MPSGVPPVPRAARRRERRIEFLFDPEEVSQALAELPALAAALGDPRREGRSATELPGIRKSARELFRVLGNAHYPHLADLLVSLDTCLQAGFTQPTLLSSRGRRPFVEALSELHVAEHFLLGGHTIGGFDRSKGNEAVPDILVETTHGRAAIEVYCPRTWPNLDEYTDAIRDRVKNLDHAIDFDFFVAHERLAALGPDGHLLHLHPAQISDGLGERTRLDAIASLLSRIQEALPRGAPARARVELPAINLATTIGLHGIVEPACAVPTRSGVISGPTISGYVPEAIFSDMVDRVAQKLREGQALRVAPGTLPVLVVDMARTELTSELADTAFYRPAFESALNARLTGLHGYGAVVFCESLGSGTRLILHFVIADEAVAEEAAVRQLLG